MGGILFRSSPGAGGAPFLSSSSHLDLTAHHNLHEGLDYPKVKDKGFHSHQKLCIKYGTYNAQNRELGDAGDFLACLCSLLLNLSTGLCVTCLDVLVFTNHDSGEHSSAKILS